MKIAITTQGKNLNSEIDSRFGRAKGFLIIDSKTNEEKYIDNIQNLNAMQGAGIQSAKNIINEGVKILITGHVGPKAFKLLKSENIEIYTGAAGTVEETLKQFQNNKLEKAENADVESHW
jgi:predicted Fe-Mo cluster-binding NifX family protein